MKNKEMSVNFTEICNIIKDIYLKVSLNNNGKVADYIPQLSKVNPNLFGISACTVDGKRFCIGDTNIPFCVQSCGKPLLYCIAQDLYGADYVHKYIGYEPSGKRFNAFTLCKNIDGSFKPHNPMVNAGAIVASSLILPNAEPSERYGYIVSKIKEMAGNSGHIGFDNSVYLSESGHAHRNYALCHFMAEKGVFVNNSEVSIRDSLNLYFQLCSIESDVSTMSIIAGTLANNGICPLNNKRVINEQTCKNCLSLMYMCGMYDYSGRFAFEVGLPAKSGVSGCLLLIIPNIMGMCIWSPRLDEIGNSVRGLEVCKMLINQCNFHTFDRLVKYKSNNDNNIDIQFITAASKGDIELMKNMIINNNIDVNIADYDKRTALHLACTEGNIDVVSFLLEHDADISLKDRWGNTAYHEAYKHISSDIDNEYNVICNIFNEINNKDDIK